METEERGRADYIRFAITSQAIALILCRSASHSSKRACDLNHL